MKFRSLSKTTLSLIVASCAVMFYSPPADAQKLVKLKSFEITKVKVGGKTALCGYVGGKWAAVKKQGKLYGVTTANKSFTKACKGLLAKGKLKSLDGIPSAATIARSKSSGAASLSRHATLAATSGTAPTLLELARGDVNPAAVFWREGVLQSIVDGDSSPEQCGEFFGGSGSDGSSGGYTACYATQNVGYSFQSILQGATTGCYLKNAPSAENFASGGISLVSGELPSGGITELFSTPAGSSARLVKINISGDPGQGEGQGGGENEGPGENIFIKVFSAAQNAATGDHYRVQLLFCNPGSDTPRGVQNMRVKINGQFISDEVNEESEGRFSNSLRAFLRSTSDGLEFDTSRPRIANLSSDRDDESFKSEVEIDSNDIITTKTADSFFGQQRKAISVSLFSGTSVSNLRFLQGAYKEDSSWGTMEAANEFREPNYVSSDSVITSGGINLKERLGEIGFDDSFFTSESSSPIDLSQFSCSAEPTVEVAMDFSVDTMQAVGAACEGERLDGMNFCRENELVAQAEQSYVGVCQVPPPSE